MKVEQKVCAHEIRCLHPSSTVSSCHHVSTEQTATKLKTASSVTYCTSGFKNEIKICFLPKLSTFHFAVASCWSILPLSGGIL